jgi:tRNA pseudouridine38-40 synthase
VALIAEQASGVLLRVAYDGTAMHGFVRQRNLRTVEQLLADAVEALIGSRVPLRASSRTDAGVHALDQLVALDPPRALPLKGWVLGLNQHLPADVAVQSAHRVPAAFVPRFACASKRYQYRVLQHRSRLPQRRFDAWLVHDTLAVAVMQIAAQALVGEHDFAAFHSARDDRENTVREVLSIKVEAVQDALAGQAEVQVNVVGKGFMHNMVRIMVGTLVDIGRGRLPPDAALRALESGSRIEAGATAPAHGLTLMQSALADESLVTESWP